jgi:hypothetical protein
VLKAQVSPAGKLDGQANFNAAALSAVVPFDVTVTKTLPEVLAAIVSEAGSMAAVNAPMRLIEAVAGEAEL